MHPTEFWPFARARESFLVKRHSSHSSFEDARIVGGAVLLLLRDRIIENDTDIKLMVINGRRDLMGNSMPAAFYIHIYSPYIFSLAIVALDEALAYKSELRDEIINKSTVKYLRKKNEKEKLSKIFISWYYIYIKNSMGLARETFYYIIKFRWVWKI